MELYLILFLELKCNFNSLCIFMSNFTILGAHNLYLFFYFLKDILLCGVYARREALFGNIDHARRVFDMALSSIDGLPSVKSNILLKN